MLIKPEVAIQSLDVNTYRFIKRSTDQFCLPGSKKCDVLKTGIPCYASYLGKCDILTMLCGQTNLHISSAILFWMTVLSC